MGILPRVPLLFHAMHHRSQLVSIPLLVAVSGLLFVYLDSMAQYAGSGLKLIVSADTKCSVMSTSTRCIQYTLWCQQILLPGRSAGLHGFRAATLLLPPNRSSLFACLAIGRSTIFCLGPNFLIRRKLKDRWGFAVSTFVDHLCTQALG